MDYFEGITKAVEDAEFIKLTFTAFGVLIALVLLILFMQVIKRIVNKRVRGIKPFSMTFGDLEKMRSTGLISDAEYARIKTGIVRAISKNIDGEKPRADESIQDLANVSIAPLPNRSTIKHAPPFSDVVTKEPEPSRPKTLDIDALLQRGIISEEEYEALSKITRRNPSDS